MRKVKEYKECRFSVEVLQEALKVFRELTTDQGRGSSTVTLSVQHENERWSYDEVEDFYPDYRKNRGSAEFSFWEGAFSLDANFTNGLTTSYTMTRISAPTKRQIEQISEVFERNAAASKLPPRNDLAPTEVPRVFIGHGRNPLWAQLKDHLQDKHQIKVEAYETGARAGHTIRDILEDLIQTSTFALLVLTGEDEQADGTVHARQNVIHEAGLFQGRLGFSRAVVLLEEGVQEFSNIAGIQYVPFSRGNIKETFGEVVATIRREFKSV